MPRGKTTSKNAPGAGTIRKKTVKRNGKEYTYWEARYTTGYDPGTGKQIQKSITGKTQKEVSEKLRETTHEIDTGEYIDPTKLTVAQWLDIWKSDYLLCVKPATARIYTDNIENHIKPALGAIRLDMLAPHDIQRFYNSLKSSGGRAVRKDPDGNPVRRNGKVIYDPSPLSPKTIKGIHGVFHSALRQAQRNGYIRYNPTEACVLPRAKKTALRPLDENETRAFLSEIRGDPFEVLFTLTLFTGLRVGEVLGLTWSRVDFKRNQLLIDRQLQQVKGSKGKYELVSTKNDKERTICVAPWVMDLLRHHRAAQAEMRLRAGSIWGNSDYVFTNEFGEHLAYRTLIKHYKKAVAAIGRPDARFHDLRHSYAVAAIRAGDDIKTVQGNLGHATAAFTLDVYGHVTDQMKQVSADRMNDYILRVLPG